MATVDVTVLGAGVFGLSVAFACAKRGAAVRVIDPNGIASGASGGLVGALAPHVPEQWNAKKEFQFVSLVAASDFWSEVAELSGKDAGYLRSGRLQPLADDAAIELARAREISANDLWQGKAQWRLVKAESLGNWAPQSGTGWLVHDTLTARIHPRNATRALAHAFCSIGGSIERAGKPEGKIVEATGFKGLVEMSQDLGRSIGNGVKGQAALLKFDAAEQPQLFADALHIVPHSDGTVAIGSTSEREFVDATSTDAQLDDVIERARRAFPVLANAPVLERWAAVRPRARSRAPMLGFHPTRQGRFVANGGFKIGFGMAPMVGEVMADFVLDGRDTIPDDFRPEASLPRG